MYFIILVGVISGIISGLGMGGGTVLILILTAFFSVDQHIAQATNLIYFIPTSIAAIIVHFKNKNVDVKLAKKIIPMGIIGAVAGSYLANQINSRELKSYFGIFLLIVGIYEFFMTIITYTKEKKENNINKKRIKMKG